MFWNSIEERLLFRYQNSQNITDIRCHFHYYRLTLSELFHRFLLMVGSFWEVCCQFLGSCNCHLHSRRNQQDCKQVACKKKKFNSCNSWCLMYILVKLYLNTRQQQFHGCLILQFVLSNCPRYHYIFCIEHSILIFYNDFVSLDLKEYFRFFFSFCVCLWFNVRLFNLDMLSLAIKNSINILQHIDGC